MRKYLIFIFNLIIISSLFAKSYTSHVSVNLIRPLIIKVADADLGTYIIGGSRPEPKKIKMTLEDLELYKQVNLSVNPVLVMEANGGKDKIQLDVQLSKEHLMRKDSSPKDLDTNITVTFKTLPKIPGSYTGVIVASADYN